MTGGGITYMSSPAGCTGDNSAASIAARLNDTDCENGLFLAVPGLKKEIP